MPPPGVRTSSPSTLSSFGLATPERFGPEPFRDPSLCSLRPARVRRSAPRSAPRVGVKNSDQELDLRLRNAARRRASTFSGRHGREHPASGCLALGRGHAEPPGLDLSASDSPPSTFGSRAGAPRGPSRGCDWPVSGRRPAPAKQVTGVIGVSDPFRPPTASPTPLGARGSSPSGLAIRQGGDQGEEVTRAGDAHPARRGALHVPPGRNVFDADDEVEPLATVPGGRAAGTSRERLQGPRRTTAPYPSVSDPSPTIHDESASSAPDILSFGAGGSIVATLTGPPTRRSHATTSTVCGPDRKRDDVQRGSPGSRSAARTRCLGSSCRSETRLLEPMLVLRCKTAHEESMHMKR
jgi:hypothetical protein